MAWAPIFMLTQPSSVSAHLGQTVTISCTRSDETVATGNYPSWYQQKPGSAPQMLIYLTNSRPSGIPDRFSGAISGNKAALTINRVKAEDEADYYCAVYTGSSGEWSTVIQPYEELRPKPYPSSPHQLDHDWEGA
uniref:Ig-like domain-containing protein n=1 Tax=Sphenodon punctatus TaxID=8508 RepID=A0A8D0GWM1_SPHPU